jgi:LuxR family glucitol operon transcriptional activator
MPAAIEYALGQLTSGYLFQDMLPRLVIPDNDFCRFYLQGSIQPLQGQLAHQLLMALALFPQSALREAIVETAGCEVNPADAFARLYQLSLVTFREGRYGLLPLTREYVLTELQQYPDFAAEARRRWLGWYVGLAQSHIPKYWTRWQDYRAIEPEWENFQTAIEWCVDEELYGEFWQLWNLANGYTFLLGYWQQRLRWLRWWLGASPGLLDPIIRLQALRDLGWTLALLGKPEQYAEAEVLFGQVWAERHLTDNRFQLDVLIEQGILFALQDRFREAETCLHQAQQLLQHIIPQDLDCRYQGIRIDYYGARIAYGRGAYEQARGLYQAVVEAARRLGWQQMVVYGSNWLGEIALEQGDVEGAEGFLRQSLPLAKAVGDRRSIAFHKRSWAQLEQLRRNPSAFERWAQEAEQEFRQLGMVVQAEEMRSWLAPEAEKQKGT